MQNTIIVGEVLRPQGLSGAVKIKAITDNPQRFKKLKSVYLGNSKTPIEQVSFMGDFVVLKFEGIDDRNAADDIRGKILSIDKQDAIDPGEGYFISDLIGASVVDDCGLILGTIKDINAFGAADIIECVDKGGKKFRFPHLEHVVKNVDVSTNKCFTVFADELARVVVYDD